MEATFYTIGPILIIRAIILTILHWDCYLDYYCGDFDVHSEHCKLEGNHE